jgi:hypothetical protein
MPQLRIDHRPREIGQTWLWGELKKIAHFEKLENLRSVFKNGLFFWAYWKSKFIRVSRNRVNRTMLGVLAVVTAVHQ